MLFRSPPLNSRFWKHLLRGISQSGSHQLIHSSRLRTRPTQHRQGFTQRRQQHASSDGPFDLACTPEPWEIMNPDLLLARSLQENKPHAVARVQVVNIMCQRDVDFIGQALRSCERGKESTEPFASLRITLKICHGLMGVHQPATNEAVW